MLIRIYLPYTCKQIVCYTCNGVGRYRLINIYIGRVFLINVIHTQLPV
jgi:hypothetical protein